MNERIEELKLKAIDFADATYKYDLSKGFQIQEWDKIRIDEFAKLVVKECMSYMKDGDIDFAKFMIKRNFGVEERKGWVCPKCGIDRTKDVCPKGYTAAITGDCPMTATAQSGVEE
jgi:hypothetical protein